MCGICGIASTRGTVDPGRLAAMSATLVQRGPDSDGAYVDGRGRPRRAPPRDHRPRDGRPADRERGRPDRTSSRTARSTTTASCARELERAGHRFSDARRHRGARPPLRGARRRASRSGCAGCSRSRSGTRERGGSCSRATAYGIKPLYYREAGGELEFASELRALPRGEIDLDALEAFLAFNSVPGAAVDLPRHAQAAGRARARLGERRTRDRRATRGRPGSGGRGARRRRGRARRGAARAAARLGAGASGLRRAGRRAALGRRRLGRARRARGARRRSEPLRTFSIGFEERSFDELRRRAARRRALRDEPSRARRAARRGAAPAGARRGVRRAVRRLVGTADLPRLAARRGGREGRALGRGRRRALRRLLHVRGRPARRAPGWAARAARAPLVERLPSSSARASFDYKAKRFVRAAHLPPLERHHGWKEIFSPDARAELTGRAQRLRPGRPPARALRGDRGRRAARAAAGRRPRHLPRRRPAREDRPRVDGALARGARPVPRLRRDELRLRAADAAQGARAARRRCCCARPPRRCCRARSCDGRKRGFSIPAAAWLRGELEPFARETLSAGDAAPPGLLPARSR